MQQLAHLSPQQIDKARAAIELARRRSRGDFTWFINNVFRASFDEFVTGQYLNDVGAHFTKSRFTMDVTGRDHFKSTRLYADIMWAIFTDEGKGFEAHYFSYNTDLAAYHMKKLKKYISRNIFFAGIKDHKPSSESIVDYSWPTGDHMTVTPQGLLSGKRGIHAERIYVDDPFKSEEEGSLLEPAQIRKINGVIKSELIPMVKKNGYFRIVGTPQTPSDFFFDSGMQKIFDTWIVAAITDEVNKIALWPEWKSYDILIALRESLGLVKFNKEYMAMPASSANSYLDKDELLALCTIQSPRKWQHQADLADQRVVAGFDIGKKVHPSHLAIFLKKPVVDPKTNETDWEYEQLFSMWMDGWDYLKQVEYLNMAIERFNISKLYYDNTRGEFEFAMEQRMLNKRYWEPIVLNSKNEAKMAAFFGSLVDRKKVRFINESRQINQLLAVTNDLKAIESPQGHGDSFWSNVMATYESRATSPGVRVI